MTETTVVLDGSFITQLEGRGTVCAYTDMLIGTYITIPPTLILDPSNNRKTNIIKYYYA